MTWATSSVVELIRAYAPRRIDDEVRRLVQDMEGGFVEGFGDGTRAVQELAPISPTAAGITASERFIQDSGKDTRQLEQKRLLTAGVGASLSRA